MVKVEHSIFLILRTPEQKGDRCKLGNCHLLKDAPDPGRRLLKPGKENLPFEATLRSNRQRNFKHSTAVNRAFKKFSQWMVMVSPCNLITLASFASFGQALSC